MYHFRSEIDWSLFFRFDKQWVEDMYWAHLSSAAKAVLPVIACHTDSRGESFPGEETISALSGRTAKVVRHGIKDLQGFPGLEWDFYHTKRGRRSKRFNFTFPPKGERGRSFFFYRGIMDGGNWLSLKPTAQALYPALRFFARYDAQEDDESEGDFKERYDSRTWEFCNAEIGLLAKYAGIERHAIRDAVSNLQKHFLLDPHESIYGERAWKVYIIPPKYFTAASLNNRSCRGFE